MSILLLEPEVEKKSNTRGTDKQPIQTAGHEARTARPAITCEKPAIPVETFKCGLNGAFAGVAFGVVFCIFGLSDGSEGGFAVGLIGAAVAIACVWWALTTPYEVRTCSDWVEFISRAETRRVQPWQIRGFVRHVDKESQILHHLEVALCGSSITLYTESERLFKSLSRISPKAWVRTEEFVPSDGD